jgi:septal ring factor EnvC (AmiA/AmiB activator)
MLDALAVPPKLVVRALDDLHTLADGVRRLTEREGDLNDLLASVQVLPKVEDELSAEIARLRGDVQALMATLAPLNATIDGLHAEIKDLRARIPGI